MLMFIYELRRHVHEKQIMKIIRLNITKYLNPSLITYISQFLIFPVLIKVFNFHSIRMYVNRKLK